MSIVNIYPVQCMEKMWTIFYGIIAVTTVTSLMQWTVLTSKRKKWENCVDKHVQRHAGSPLFSNFNIANVLYGNACDISHVKLSHWNPPWLILVIFCRLSSPMANFYPPFLSIPSCFLVKYKKKTEGLEKSGINRSLVKHTIEWFS